MPKPVELTLTVTEVNIILAALTDYKSTIKTIKELADKSDCVTESQRDACGDTAQKLLLTIEKVKRRAATALGVVVLLFFVGCVHPSELARAKVYELTGCPDIRMTEPDYKFSQNDFGKAAACGRSFECFGVQAQAYTSLELSSALQGGGYAVTCHERNPPVTVDIRKAGN